VPAEWTVTYRFILASAGMVVLALARRESLVLAPGGLRLAAAGGAVLRQLSSSTMPNIIWPRGWWRRSMRC
jgi:hypothetical protein